MRRSTYHDIHTGELRPDLCEDTNVGSVDHIGLKQFEKGDIGIVAFEFDNLPNVTQLPGDEW